jgi:four helix bundle protein
MNTPRGHMKMRVWQNSDQLDLMIKDLSNKIPKQNSNLISQISRASNSILANYVEGYYSGSLKEYVRFVYYSKRSLGELMEHIRFCLRREFISEVEFNELNGLSWRTMYLIDRLIASLKKKMEEDKKCS